MDIVGVINSLERPNNNKKFMIHIPFFRLQRTNETIYSKIPLAGIINS